MSHLTYFKLYEPQDKPLVWMHGEISKKRIRRYEADVKEWKK